MKYCRLLLLLTTAFPLRSRAEIHLPADAPECVRWAAGELRARVMQLHLDPARVDVEVHITPQRAPGTSLIEEQSFTLSLQDRRVRIRAGGSVGAMYGLQELTEQIALHPALDWKAQVRQLHPTTQRPFLEVRADNPFIHVYPILLNDLAMWHDYIDMLARNRFNLLDLHGAYDLDTTSFPNLYPQLIEVPGFPDAGGFTPKYRAHNLASLRAILAYAKTRGVRVSLMNYSAHDNKGGVGSTDAKLTNVPADKLASYTAQAVTLLIRQLPDLYMLGFRVGESMQPASFYREAYIRGVDEAHRPDLRLYTRSWQTTKEHLEPIAAAAHHGFDIEIKFNGEHLGLPYQAMQGAAYGSYSYQQYLDVPANYTILWQIRANGTHRFWAWENTAFIRRTVRACRLGDARGFTLEPHTAYFNVNADEYYRSAADAGVYNYIWQKHWMWYLAWGRLGYDPQLDEAKIAAAFRDHYGAAGPAAYRAMQAAGEIVPLAYAYRFVGPDQRDFSPETETGDFDTDGKRSRQDLLQFAENHPEDERSFAGIDAYVRNKLAGTPDGRYGPYAVANRMQAAADRTRAALAEAPPLTGRPAAEYRLLKTDLLSASYLGDFYVQRIHAMTDLDFALRTGQPALFTTAEAELARSRDAWQRLSTTADGVFKPLSNPLRFQRGYQWSSQLERLAQLDATADSLWQQREKMTLPAPLAPNPTDQGSNPGLSAGILSHELRSGSATITCAPTAANGVAALMLWWKPLPSELAWQSLRMTPAPDGRFTAAIPVDRHGAMYLVEIQDRQGNAKNFPDEALETPYRVIPAEP